MSCGCCTAIQGAYGVTHSPLTMSMQGPAHVTASPPCYQSQQQQSCHCNAYASPQPLAYHPSPHHHHHHPPASGSGHLLVSPCCSHDASSSSSPYSQYGGGVLVSRHAPSVPSPLHVVHTPPRTHASLTPQHSCGGVHVQSQPVPQPSPRYHYQPRRQLIPPPPSTPPPPMQRQCANLKCCTPPSSQPLPASVSLQQLPSTPQRSSADQLLEFSPMTDDDDTVVVSSGFELAPHLLGRGTGQCSMGTIVTTPRRTRAAHKSNTSQATSATNVTSEIKPILLHGSDTESDGETNVRRRSVRLKQETDRPQSPPPGNFDNEADVKPGLPTDREAEGTAQCKYPLRSLKRPSDSSSSLPQPSKAKKTKKVKSKAVVASETESDGELIVNRRSRRVKRNHKTAIDSDSGTDKEAGGTVSKEESVVATDCDLPSDESVAHTDENEGADKVPSALINKEPDNLTPLSDSGDTSSQQRTSEEEEDTNGGDSEKTGREPDQAGSMVREEPLSQQVDSKAGRGGSGGRGVVKKSVVLTQWHIDIISQGVVVLKGMRQGDSSGKLWGSGPVLERLSARLLATKSGSLYHLMGPLDRPALAATATRLSRAFSNGFPKNWEAVLEKNSSSSSEGGESEAVVKQKPVKEEPPTPVLDSTITSASFISSLKRSSRGRTLKPSREALGWHNSSDDLYSYSMDGSFTGLTNPATTIDLTLLPDEPPLPPRRAVRSKVKKEKAVSLGGEGDRVANHLSVKPRSAKSASDVEGSLPKRRRKRRSRLLPSSLRPKPRTVQCISVVKTEEGSSQSEGTAAAVTGLSQSQTGDVITASENESEGGKKLDTVTTRSTRKTALSETSTQSSKQPSAKATCDSPKKRLLTPRREKKTTAPLEDNFVAPQLPPRKGHPAKARLPDSAAQTSVGDVSPVRKRGRPRKRRQTESVEADRPSKRSRTAAEEEEAAEAGRPSKRSRTAAGDEAAEWSREEIARLKNVVHEVPAITVNFWEVVAESLGTGHSARECSSQYLSTTSKQTRKQHQTTTTTTARVTQSSGAGGKKVVITGRCGTLKRKKQLRNALEHMDDGYSDDIFDSTPFKNTMKTVKLPDISDDAYSDDEEEEEDGEGAPHSGRGSYHTPNESLRRLGAPAFPTPRLCDYLSTPDLKSGLKREAADHLMFRMAKAKKKPTATAAKKAQQAVSQKTRGRGGGGRRKQLLEQKLRNIRTGELTTVRLLEDSDEDDDSLESPFFDLEEACEDILEQLH